MQPYRVVAVGDRITSAVRRTLRSPGYGHPAHAEVATGHGPCRQCLKGFVVGDERRILFTYDSFHGKEDLPCRVPFSFMSRRRTIIRNTGAFRRNCFPAVSLLTHTRRAGGLIAQSYVSDGVVEAEIRHLLQDPKVSYIHVRDTDAGCYDFCIERTEDEESADENQSSKGGFSHE